MERKVKSSILTRLRRAQLGHSRTKVSEDLALVTLHSVDMDKMQAFTSSPDFQKLIEPYVAKHVPYVCTPLN